MAKNRPLCVLIVDDEPNNVEILIKRLRSEGYCTTHAYNGPDAIRCAIQEMPDLIILDVMMPGMSGYDVLRHLQENPVTCNIPVVFLSAQIEIDDRVHGLQLGAVDYITKPFHPRELMARISNILKQSTDLQKIRMEYEKAQAMLIIDELTGLYNRRYLLERFSEELKRSQRYQYPLACLMIDIDFFKKINDLFGHLAGDQILSELAQIFKNSMRAVDLVARFGGEEFMVLLPQTDTIGALQVAEKIRHQLEEHCFFIDCQPVQVTVSIGITVYNENNIITVEELIDQADNAMYEAKRSGRNRIHLYRPS